MDQCWLLIAYPHRVARERLSMSHISRQVRIHSAKRMYIIQHIGPATFAFLVLKF